MPIIPPEQFDAWSEELVRFYGQAETQLRAVIDSALSTPYNRRRAELLLQQVDSIVDGLKQQQLGWSSRVLPQSYRSGVRLASGVMGFPVLPQMTMVQRRAIEAAIGRVTADTSDALASVAPLARRVWTDSSQRIVSEQTIAEQTALGRVEGLGPRELGRRIRQTLRDGATERLKEHLPPEELENLRRVADGDFISLLCKDGKTRIYDLTEYSDMVAHATSRMAATEGTLQQTVDFGGDLVAWTVSQNACDDCEERQGEVFSITGENPDFPPLEDDDKPPLHPWCQHSLVPADEDDLRARGIYDALSDFSKGDETVGDNVEYANMLRAARGQEAVPEQVPA